MRIASPLCPVAPGPPRPVVQPRPLWGSRGEERPLVGLFISPEAPPMPVASTGWALLPGGASRPPTRDRAAHSPALSFPGASGLWPQSRLEDGDQHRPHPPFTRWLRSRGNARRQLGTRARLCPPPVQATSARGEGQAAPKKPLQDGALEILSTNYESGDKQGICKSISDRTFPGKRFIQAGLKPGPLLGHLVPPPVPALLRELRHSVLPAPQPRCQNPEWAGGWGARPWPRRAAGGPCGAFPGAGPGPRVHGSTSLRLLGRTTGEPAGLGGRQGWVDRKVDVTCREVDFA